MYDTDTTLNDTDTTVTDTDTSTTDTDTTLTETDTDTDNDTDTTLTETDNDNSTTDTDTTLTETDTDTNTTVTDTVVTDTTVESSGNIIYGTSSNDFINISQSGSVRSLGGDDTIRVKSKNVDAYGGSGDDLIIVDAYYYGNLTDITISGGDGYDTIQISPDSPYGYNDLGIVITDFSNKDVLRLDASDYYYSDSYSSYRKLTQAVIGGNVVIRDNVSVNSYYGTSERVTPKFSVTLQGVSDISQVANAPYYRYSYGYLSESKTLGELFSEPEVEIIENESTNDTDTTLTTGGDSDTTLYPAPVTISGGIGSTVPTVINYGTNSQATVAATVTTAGGSGDTVLAVNNSLIGGGSGSTVLNGPVLIDSTVTGGIGNTYYVTVNGTLEINHNYYTYEGGYRFLENYSEDQIVKLNSDYRGIDIVGNNFIVKSGTGQLEIQNARDKFISYSGNDGRVTAYSYLGSTGGYISGQATVSSQIDILIGGDDQNNHIRGGYGSSSLWGGGGNNGHDTLVGGYSYNEFFYAVGNGDDVVLNANSNDLINLASVRLSQITNVEVDIGQVNINFVDGGRLEVSGGNDVRYQIAEGTYKVNQYTNRWSDSR